MKTGKVVLVVQARMRSTRLPGKSLMPLAGEPLVYRLLERAMRTSRVDELVLAIPDGPADMPLRGVAERLGLECFSGSEDDVLDRYYQAARRHQAEIVLRLPADNPAVEPVEIDRLVEFHCANDFTFSTNLSPAFGNGYPDGLGAEAIDFWALEHAWRESVEPQQREHVHLSFFDYVRPINPTLYPVGVPQCPAEIARPELVLDVNTVEQYRYLSALYDYLYPRNPQFGIREIIKWHDNVWCRS